MATFAEWEMTGHKRFTLKNQLHIWCHFEQDKTETHEYPRWIWFMGNDYGHIDHKWDENNVKRFVAQMLSVRIKLCLESVRELAG